VDDEQQYTLQYGMNNRFIEPWFECEVKQRFDDNLEGYINGIYTTYSVYQNARQKFINVHPYELTGKYTD